jgi:CRP-like cAMP-binding protein
MPVPQSALQPFPLFQGLSDAALGVLAQSCRMRDVPQGMSLFLQGSPGEGLFLVASGEIDIVSGRADEARVLCTLQPGEHLGELALLRPGTRKVTAKARVPSRLIEMKRSDFNELMKQNPAVCFRLMLNVFTVVERRLDAVVAFLE